MFKRTPALIAALLLAWAVPLSVQAANPRVHYTLLQDKPKLPKKIVILPVSVEVLEVTAGDVKEVVPEWSLEAGNNIMKSLSAAIKKDPTLSEAKLPKLSGRDNSNVDEHIALYKLVGNTASYIRWAHKVRRFDYGIGPGLDFLRRKTGADAALMVYGRDHVSTAGRKAKAVLGNIPIVNWFTGPPPRLGNSFIHIGMVDLKTGNLLWMNSEYRDGASNLRDYEDADDIISTIFEWYPGIDEYRSAYVD